ncbi:MAG: hypothetical protein ACOYOU_09740 [Kiritimatiellia bacterium]
MPQQTTHGSAEVLSGGLAPPEAKICERKEAAKFFQAKNGARSGRSGHTSRRCFFFDFFAFSLLTLIFPFRRHKAAGDGRQTFTGRTPETGKNLYVRYHRPKPLSLCAKKWNSRLLPKCTHRDMFAA